MVSSSLVKTETVDNIEWKVIDTNGPGRPVIMLPGMQATAEFFVNQITRFGSERRLIAVSYPSITDVDELVQGLGRLINSLKIDTFDLIGTSLGGYFAQKLASIEPTRVKLVVLGNTFSDPRPIQMRMRTRSEIFEIAPQQLIVEALSRMQNFENLSESTENFKTFMIEQLQFKQQAESLKANMICLASADVITEKAFGDEQVLILGCYDDPLVTEDVRQSLIKLYPGSKRVTLEIGGHFPAMLGAENYNRAVETHLWGGTTL